jgi:hypothetical protein
MTWRDVLISGLLIVRSMALMGLPPLGAFLVLWQFWDRPLQGEKSE